MAAESIVIVCSVEKAITQEIQSNGMIEYLELTDWTQVD
jgi:hypothetical protein